MANRFRTLGLGLLVAGSALAVRPAPAAVVTLVNVSYDATRELYDDFNKAFSSYWEAQTGDTVVVRQSHGASGQQARSVIDGLEADVVTLALAGDVDAIARHDNLLPDNWQTRFPQNSTPYTSTVVFLVRRGNPLHIVDWNDLVRTGVKVITANPKTSGGARWNYLAAWAYALKQPGGTPATAQEFVNKLFKNVPVLDAAARAATITFVQHGIGDVLVAWENEAHQVLDDQGQGSFDIIYPSVSILAEPPVAVVDKVAQRRGTTAVAQAYLQYLYSKEGQDIIARNYYRPRDAAVAAQYAHTFGKTGTLVTIADFGGWAKAQATHFDDGGTFDHSYAP
jgi:sulfate/thiosulfate transport system substrate-binding protein